MTPTRVIDAARSNFLRKDSRRRRRKQNAKVRIRWLRMDGAIFAQTAVEGEEHEYPAAEKEEKG